MSIETRLNAINDHLVEDYSVLTLAGADLTNVNKNIVNLKPQWQERLLYFMNNGTQEVWNNWDKVNGSGTSLSLNNTEEAPMSLTYKGDTYQYQKNAENYFSPTNIRDSGYISSPQYFRPIAETGTTSGTLVSSENVTLSWNNTTKKLSISGSWASASPSYLSVLKIGEIPAGTYTLTLSTGAIKYMQLSTESVGGTTLCSISKNGTSATFTINEPTVAYLGFNFSEGTYDVEYSFNLTDGIVTPSPDYPSPVHVVNGDNSIEVCGKNLFDGVWEEGQISSSTGQDQAGSGVRRTKKYIPIQPNTVYTLSRSSSNGTMPLRFYDKNKNYLGYAEGLISTKTIKVFTSLANAYYIRLVDWANGSTDTQLELGDQATTYEEYKGASYPISLGVENLFDASKTDLVNYTYNNGQYTSTIFTTSGYNNSRIYDNNRSFDLKNGETYYISLQAKLVGGTGNINTLSVMKTGNVAGTGTRTWIEQPTISYKYQKYVLKYECTENAVFEQVYIQVNSSSNLQITVKDIMVSKENANYTPFGTTPIELCKIGTYQDKIDKSSGKNLFNGEIRQGNQNSATGVPLRVFSNQNDLPITSGETITFSTDLDTNTFDYNIYIAEKPFLTASNTMLWNSNYKTNASYTFTAGYTGYLGFTVRRKNETNISPSDIAQYHFMIQKGDIQNPTYEPYGTDWYLKKEIGKVVLNGSESWGNEAQRYRVDNIIQGKTFTTFDTNNPLAYCNYFKWGNGVSSNFVEGAFWYTANGLNLSLQKDENPNATTLAQFKNWLSSNNVTVYYVLATPTYETITDTTLKNQLEEAKKSYEGQTNTSQENNDLPFELDVVALSDGTTQIFSAPLLGSMSTQEEPETLEEVLEEPEEETA